MAFGAIGDGGQGDFGSGLNSNQGFRPLSQSPVFGMGGGQGGGGFGGALGDYFGKQQDFLNRQKLDQAGYQNQQQLADKSNLFGFAGQALNAQTSRYNTDVNDATNRYGVGQQAATAQRGQDVSSATQKYLGDQQTGLGYFNTQTQADTSRYNTDTNRDTNRYGIDTQANTARQGQANQLREAQIQASAATLPYTIRQGQFNHYSPQFEDFATKPYVAGSGQVGSQPQIAAGPVWSDAQVQQQVNNQRAGIDAKTAGDVQNMNASVAGRGFGGNSPLAQALAVNFRGQGLAAGANAEQATRWQAAQGNATHLLAGQQAQEAQFSNRQQEDVARRGQWLEQYKSLAGLLGANS